MLFQLTQKKKMRLKVYCGTVVGLLHFIQIRIHEWKDHFPSTSISLHVASQRRWFFLSACIRATIYVAYAYENRPQRERLNSYAVLIFLFWPLTSLRVSELAHIKLQSRNSENVIILHARTSFRGQNSFFRKVGNFKPNGHERWREKWTYKHLRWAWLIRTKGANGSCSRSYTAGHPTRSHPMQRIYNYTFSILPAP